MTSLRPQILLIHGLGTGPDWWQPFLAPLRTAGCDPLILALPSLEEHGPEAWVEAALKLQEGIDLLVGHSLGAAVALEAARRFSSCRGAVLLAMPTLNSPDVPPPPRKSGLSAVALRGVGAFIRRATSHLEAPPFPAIHLVGRRDRFVVLAQTRAWPFPTEVIAGADHDLRGSPEAVRRVVATVAQLAATQKPA